jgi:hypothetical protein
MENDFDICIRYRGDNGVTPTYRYLEINTLRGSAVQSLKAKGVKVKVLKTKVPTESLAAAATFLFLDDRPYTSLCQLRN